MNSEKTLVIDADAHVIENDHTWDFLEPSEAKYRPKVVSDPNNPLFQYWEVDGRRGPPALTVEGGDDPKERAQESDRQIGTPRESRLLVNVDSRLNHMDALNIDIQVLHNTLFLYDMTEDPDAEAALTRSWNKWLGEIWKMSNGRLPWSCMVPTRLLDEAKIQMRAAKENGAVAVCMRPLEGEHLITDPYFYPLMEEAQKLDLSMAIHIANGNAANVDLYGSVPAAHPAAGFGIFRVPTVTACMYLVLSEIPELFPKLRWGIIEASAQWIPWVHREATRRSERDGKALPEDLFGGKNIFVTCQSDEDIPWILKYAGDNCLMVGTDYGHNDTSSDLNMISMLRARDDISAAAKERILSHNPKALYGLDIAG